MDSFSLIKSIEGYNFSYASGDCCTIYYYDGIIYLKDNKIINCKIIKIKKEKVPC
jgi:hypothetical protein